MSSRQPTPVAVVFDVNDEAGRQRFLDQSAPELFARLAPEDKAVWGHMSAQQMIEHLTWVFDTSTGVAWVSCDVSAPQRNQFKAFLYNKMQSPHDLKNPALASGLPPLTWPTLTAAVTGLNAARRRFLESAKLERSATFVHPLLGPLDYEEWARFHFKHVVHHLVQFGLVTALV